MIDYIIIYLMVRIEYRFREVDFKTKKKKIIIFLIFFLKME